MTNAEAIEVIKRAKQGYGGRLLEALDMAIAALENKTLQRISETLERIERIIAEEQQTKRVNASCSVPSSRRSDDGFGNYPYGVSVRC